MGDILRRQFLNYVGQTSPSPLMIEIERAEGVFLYSPDGKRYYDLISGVSVSNVGHGNRRVVEAVKRQAENYMHLMVYGELVQRPQVEYAGRIAGLLPEGLDSVYFVNSGSEAIEGALKLAKRYTGRIEIISFNNAYHGSTHGSLSVMGDEQYKSAFRPLLPATRQIPYNDFNAIEQITVHTAAVLVEPIQGEAGIRLPHDGYLKALRKRCDETGTLLIFDEIQTGMGRCGTFFALEKAGVVPDIICLAKAFGGGMPLGAFISSGKIMATLTHNPVLGHITTFGGHPVCCAAGLAALEFMLENKIVDEVEGKGALFEELLSTHPSVMEIRRSGLLMAIELGNSSLLFRTLGAFAEEGIMSDWFLFCDTAFRISPPLTITEEEIRHCCSIILRILDRF